MATDIQADNRALRYARRERALGRMAAHDLDILVLGRQANVRYVTGAPQLWIAGTRPFGPICVVVRATGEIYLNSTADEGIPEEIDHDHLYGLAWNPMTLIAVLQKIEGASAARRVGTDALSPTFAKLLPIAFPNAELVDGESTMQAARRIKTPEELTAMSAALRVAEDGVAAALAELQPGMPVKTLAGAVLEAMAAGGVSTPATQDAAWVTSRDHPWQHGGGDGRVQSGDLVVFAAGALADGYVGEVARTWPVDDAGNTAIRKLYQRSNMLWNMLISACRPGAATADLLAVYDAAKEPLPPMPVAYGLGLGFDPPVVTPALPRSAAQERLDAGMVLSLTGYVWQEGVGAVLTRDAVQITDDGPAVLTASPSWAESATRSVRPPAPASG